MEYSSFSSGTEHAVKTWQAALRAIEDGIMTADLLERLFGISVSETTKNEEHISRDPKKRANGAPVTSVADITEVQQTVVTEVGMSQHRVFLLGENRWEEPSRLSGGSKKTVTKSTSGNATTKCLCCSGEGRLLCMECDGTGEPNVEPKFLGWVDEGAKCLYCEGLGHTICDICGGKTATDA